MCVCVCVCVCVGALVEWEPATELAVAVAGLKQSATKRRKQKRESYLINEFGHYRPNED